MVPVGGGCLFLADFFAGFLAAFLAFFLAAFFFVAICDLALFYLGAEVHQDIPNRVK